MRLISPNELHQAAKDAYLGGKDPINHKDWILVVNFWAANIAKGCEEPVCKMMGMIYDCPLPADVIGKIAGFQSSRKADRKSIV